MPAVPRTGPKYARVEILMGTSIESGTSVSSMVAHKGAKDFERHRCSQHAVRLSEQSYRIDKAGRW